MRFAFYKGRGGDWGSRLIGWAIRFRTNGIYSHVEAVFSREEDGKALCWSSSEMDGGSRFKWIGLDTEKWDVVDVPDLDEGRALAWCKSQNAKPYDFRAILRFALGMPLENNGIWFCSEAMIGLAQDQGRLPQIDPSRISPQDCYYLALGGFR